MSEPSTVLHVPAGVGIDQMTAPQHVQPGASNLFASNVRVTYDKALDKRPGLTRMTAANPSNAISGLKTTSETVDSYGDLIICTGQDEVGSDVLDQLIDRTASPIWITRGLIPECVPSVNDFTAATNVAYVDGGYSASAGVYVVAYMQTTISQNQAIGTYSFPHGLISVCTIDAASGELLFERSFPALSPPDSGSTPAGSPFPDILGPIKLVVIGSRVFVTYLHMQTTAGNVVTDYRCTSFDVSASSAPVFVSTVIISNDGSSVLNPYENAFDVTVYGTQLIFAWLAYNSGSPVVKLGSYLATVTPIALNGSPTTTAFSPDANKRISVALSSSPAGRLAVACSGTASAIVRTFVQVYDITFAGIFTITGSRSVQLFASRNVSVSLKSENLTAAVWTVCGAVFSTDFPNTNGSLSLSVTELTFTISGSVSTKTRFCSTVPGWSPMSRPATVGGRTYIEACCDNANNAILTDVSMLNSTPSVAEPSLRPVAWVAPRLQAFSFDVTRHIVDSGSTYIVTVQAIRRTPTAFSLRLCRYDFNPAQKRQNAGYDGKFYLSGGLLTEFDGKQPTETGFVMTPAVYGTAVGGSRTGTFNYTAIYEHVDASGNVTVSAPAPIFQIVLAGQASSMNFRGCLMTSKNFQDSRGYGTMFRQVSIKVYRTIAGGNQYFLLATIVPGDDGVVLGYTDNTTDAQLLPNASLYKVPGLLGTQKDRDSPGSLVMLCECNGVLVGVSEDLRTVRHMSQVTIGESPWHCDNWQMTLAGDGPITAISSLDGSLVIFKEKEIFIVSLDPPADNASSGGFGQPRQLAANCGCISRSSIVVTGVGIFFQSDRGIELLDRSYSISFIGNQVQTFLNSGGIVNSAVLDIRNAIVRLDLKLPGYTGQQSMIFDLTIGQWSSFDSYFRANGSAVGQYDSCYATYRGVQKYVTLAYDGVVFYEDDNSSLDDGSYFVTSYWRPAIMRSEMQRENQTYQAVLFYRADGRASISCSIEYDWGKSADEDKSWSETLTSTTAQGADTGSTHVGQLEARVSGRHQAIQFTFFDLPPATPDTGKGITWLGVSLDLAPHQGSTQGTPLLPATLRA